jgi:hypothetical protein
MNTNVMPSVIQIESESLKQLITEVKETLATDINLTPTSAKSKKFGIADLWNCQKNVRTAISMRKH